MIEKEFIKHLIKRLARVDENEGWKSDLKPAQRTALEYLGRANRFSRKPSHIADFLGSTRGTVSQTLKALAEKEFIAEEHCPELDRRSKSFVLTAKGIERLAETDTLTEALDGIPREKLLEIALVLRPVLNRVLLAKQQRDFGLCRRCKHFEKQGEGGACQLLGANLTTEETTQICYHSEPRSID
ncbi:MarR family transcriptional regulator [Octadecabacter sp. G9-8]|uniref:MarR family transcriptional regulator n=1 Tax=Octadecabacter dasysiphoniae TaxID=2909341 RepID=A0ABS9CUP3_9RHOB|nr:MarR family transcriptional regulator [Octadecabacter dasysiphoniae]MCF2870782.1 MarR family transcriptional regulator [Octadecabacter dasysiphoniae]